MVRPPNLFDDSQHSDASSSPAFQEVNLEHERKLFRLLERGLDWTGTDLRSHLQASCDDPQLIDEVMKILEAENELGDFLEESAISSLRRATEAS